MQQSYSYTPATRASLEKTISPARLSTYLRLCNADLEDALRLYYWNMSLSKSLYVPLQSLEISLRNTIADALERSFGYDWYAQPRFKAALLQKTQNILQKAVKDATTTSQRKGRSLNSGDIISNLTFGFWRQLLKSRLNNYVWKRQLSTAFPNLPSTKGRQDIYDGVDEIIRLRNRISHHEPIINHKLPDLYNSMTEIMDWICSDTRHWVEQHCDFNAVYNNRP